MKFSGEASARSPEASEVGGLSKTPTHAALPDTFNAPWAQRGLGMSNMSYCRFENTLADFKECAEVLECGEIPTSKSERAAALRMIQIARLLVDTVERDGLEEELA